MVTADSKVWAEAVNYGQDTKGMGRKLMLPAHLL